MANQYSRVFITLKQDRAGYGFKNREPSGRTIIEIRNGFGKLTLMAQDLKPAVVYKAYIVSSTKGGAAVPIGVLKIDERGKCEHKWEFDPTNVEKTDLNIDYFDAVTVIAADKQEHTWVLTGFRGAEVRFKENFYDCKKKEAAVKESVKESIAEEIAAEEKAAEEQEIIAEEVVAEEALEEEVTAEEVVAEEVVAEETIDEGVIVEEESYAEETAEDKTTADMWPDDEVMDESPLSSEESEGIHENFKAMAQKFNQELSELENYIKMKDEGMEAEEQPGSKNDLERTIEHNVSMTPFRAMGANADLANIKWVRISLKELAYLPINYRKYMNDPFMCLAYNKYRHLILGEGCTEKGKYYVVGVPEIFMREQVQHVEKLGFRVFRDCDNIVEKHKSERYGYWLLYINAEQCFE